MLQDRSPIKLKDANVRKRTPTSPSSKKNLANGMVHKQSTGETPKPVYSEISKHSLVKPVPDKPSHISNMPSHLETKGATAPTSNKRTEVELVSERVAKTKNEIEHLKAQLQKLISNGITNLSTDHKTGSEVAVSSEVDVIKEKTFKDSVADIISGASDGCQQPPAVHHRISVRPKHKSPAEEVTKKVRHYNPDEAREYIKKQKEKRKELMKSQKKEVTFTHDVKKQKLQELRKKSLELVSKNLQHKRERSRSRESQPEFASNLVPNLILDEPSKPEPSSSRKKSLRLLHLQNITVRSCNLENLSAIPPLDIPPIGVNEHLDQQHRAALKIQAVFRGYRQRKLYQALKKQRKEVEAVALKRDIPLWLQTPMALPYPYSFINAVKRKLNLAVQQATSTTVDAAVQSSLIEPDESVQAIPHEAKDKSSRKNTDLKSFLSHKCLEGDVKAAERESAHSKSTRNGFASDSDTSKNIPDISSESSNKDLLSSKRPLSSDTDQHQLKITDRVKKLKLRPPKRINFSITDLQSSIIQENIKPDVKAKWHDEISEHLLNSNNQTKSKSLQHNSEVISDLIKPENRSVGNLSARDSIIASNRCDYVTSGSIATDISAEVSNSKLKRLKPLISKTQSDPTLTKISSAFNDQDSLHSFRTYLKDLREEVPVLSEEANAKTESKLSSSRTKTLENLARSQSTLKAATTEKSKDVSVDNVSNSERAQSSIKTDSSIQKINRSIEKPVEYSSNFTSVVSSAPSLKRPSVSLRSSLRVSSSEDTDVDNGKNITHITLRPGKISAMESKVQSNEIHLKFEAELHLLNEFNDSLRQVMAVEKSLLELQNDKNVTNNKSTTTYHTRDTQTSIVTKTSTDTKITTESLAVPEIGNDSTIQTQVPTINYSRGSDVTEHLDALSLNNSITEVNDASLMTTGLELSQIKENSLTSSIEESNVDVSVSVVNDNPNGNVYTGVSLDMFEQLIKEEDARIENLKTILKIREKALVDRTKGELAWLEIQKKHLRDSGQLQEISAIKKKQRGLLIKLEHERHEMQRLKQMQKAASKERKSVLREQRNMIKAQLSTSNMITKIKRNTKEERRQSGPLKVYNIKSHSESIRSETSMSRRSSATEEVVSVVSHSQSIVSHVTEEILSGDKVPWKSTAVATVPTNANIKTDSVKRSLLMREAALQKRRKAAEELLQWHQRLVEEEGKIAELELAASAIINQIPAGSMGSGEPTAEKHKFKGSQLNLLWRNMTGRDEKKFNDQVTYSMSKITLERFCKDAKKYALGRNKSFTKKSAKQSDCEVSQLASRSSSDDRSRRRSKSYRSSSLVPTEVGNNEGTSSRIEEVISNLITEAETNGDESQVISYASDFDSVPKLVEFSNEKIVTNLSVSDKNQTEISEMSFQEQSTIGDTSEDDINTITEVSRTFKNTSVSSKPTEIVDESNASNKLSPTEEIFINASSTTEIIDEKSTEEPTRADPEHTSISEKLTNHSTADSIPKSIELHDSTSTNKIPYDDSNKISTSVNSFSMQNQSLSKGDLEIHPSSHTTEIETENKSAVTDSTAANTNKVIISLIDTPASLEIGSAPSASDESLKTLTILDESEQETDSVHTEKSDESAKTSINVATFSRNEIDERHSTQLDITENGDKTFDATDRNELLTSTNDILIDKTNESLISNKTNEPQLLDETSDHLLDKTNEDLLIIKTNPSLLTNKTNEPQFLDETSDRLPNKTHENRPGSDEISEASRQDTTINEELSVDKSVGIVSKSITDKEDEVEEEQSRNSDESAVETIENEDCTEVPSIAQENVVVVNESSPAVDNKSKTETIASIINQESGGNYSTSTNEKVKSPLELSYGFIEMKKVVDDQKTLSDNLLENNKGEMLSDTSTSYDVEPQFTLKPTIANHETDIQLSVSSEENLDKSGSSAGRMSADQQEPEIRQASSSPEDLETKHSSEEKEDKSENDSEHRSMINHDGEIGSESLSADENTKEKENLPTHETSEEKSESQSDQDQKTKDVFSSSHDNLEERKSVEEDLEVDTNVNSLTHKTSEENSESQSEDQDQNPEGGFSSSPDNLEETKSIDVEVDTNVSSPTHKTSEEKSEDQDQQTEDGFSPSHDHLEDAKSIEKDVEVNSPTHRNLEDEKSDNSQSEDVGLPAKPAEVEHVDVKKRVLEILADANIPSPRGDKSPRLQDLYVTAYDIASSDNSPASPSDDSEQNFSPPQHMYGSDEVEELLKKQLAIEQEIKEIQQQQQKEQLPYLYLREIPNKPPPPYTPPVAVQTPPSGSVLPNSESQISIITNAAADILHEAYRNNNLQNIALTTTNKRRLYNRSSIEHSCFEFVFDLCKEAALEHYNQFQTETGLSWMQLDKRSKLALGKPLDRNGLERLINQRVRQFLGYETVKSAENIKRKWCGKKRDHVDELLVVECQAEETEWTNYDRDELTVKDELAKEIMNMLLSETAQVFNNILTKKTFLC